MDLHGRIVIEMNGNCGVVKGVVMPDWSMNTIPKPVRITVFDCSMAVIWVCKESRSAVKSRFSSRIAWETMP